MIDFSPEIMGTTLVVFLFLLIFLNHTFFKPMLAHLDKRKEHLAQNQGSADGDKEEAAALRAEAAAVLAQARQEGAKLRDEATQAAKAQVEQKLEAERGRIAAENAASMKRLEEEEAALRNTLLGQAPLFKEALKAKLAVAG
jgi:F-type H+-transporting ATPase subunit b